MPARLLLSKPLAYGAGALLLAGLTAFGVQTWRIHSLQASLANSRADSVVYEATVQRLNDQLTWQNNRVKQMERDAKVLQDRLNKQAEADLRPLPEPTSPPGAEEMNRWLNRS